MKVNIGLIITESHLLNIKSIEFELENNCKLHYFVVKNNSDISKTYKQYYYDVDAFVFSGPVLYEVLEQELDLIDKPCYIMEDDLGNIYKQLLKIAVNNPNLDFSRVYIDFIDDRMEAELEDVFQKDKSPYHMHWDLGDPHVREEMILNNHLELWNEKKIDLSITKFGMIVDKLRDAGIKYNFIAPSYKYLKDLFIEVIEEVRTEKLSNNKMVIIYVGISKKILTNISEHERELIYLELRGETIRYLKDYDFIINSNETEIEIIMTIEELLKLTSNLESSGLEGYLKDKLDKEIFIGYGSGKNISQATENAINALGYAKESSSSSSVFIGEDKKIYKNLSKKESKIFVKEPNYRIIELSEKLAINATHLQNLVGYCLKMGKNKVFSRELAKELGVTERTANRILNRILEHNGASITVEKRNSGKGRPIKYYLLNFIDANGKLIY